MCIRDSIPAPRNDFQSRRITHHRQPQRNQGSFRLRCRVRLVPRTRRGSVATHQGARGNGSGRTEQSTSGQSNRLLRGHELIPGTGDGNLVATDPEANRHQVCGQNPIACSTTRAAPVLSTRAAPDRYSRKLLRTIVITSSIVARLPVDAALADNTVTDFFRNPAHHGLLI